ncbi:MAG TPA: 16S rRNA (uracil(1498)-N(3))-methyltransferase [Clostridia bacterium]|nr:16S rRNA (uracil(1498)-N(3))-methyltransferase [Clostridia bacterium]
MNRFFIDAAQIVDSHIEIAGEDAGHILRVLRYGPGDSIELCDGAGLDYPAVIVETDRDKLTVSLGEGIPSKGEPLTRITLYQGMPKSSKMDLIVQKCVELGIHSIVPLNTSRTVVNLSEARRIQKRIERWQKIAEGAAKQSHRGIIPNIGKPVAFSELVASASHSIRLIPWEGETDLGLKGYLDKYGNKIYRGNGTGIGIIIGPEGGISDEEIRLAKEFGWETVTLGPRILRTETAGMATLAAIMLYMGEME